MVGLWGILSMGRVGYELTNGDLREFVALYVYTLIAHGGIVIEGADDGIHYWRAAPHYGEKPEDVAHAVTAEWIAQGEPDIPGYEGIAFALPSYLDSPENRRDWPKPKVELPA
ncbi:hypothetical protein SLNSH_13640 [Alsobacter soli]|uniref:Uncharacterized protein n=1 Tax=Alsobacter soli TaxID=2109933 RepID=A0A2T1HS96_9HYPH|nr:hypothetical protein SLNSH_13640 [Alsobacter soli]